MTDILEFLGKYYLWFDIIALFLIFSLIGYFVSQKKEKENQFKIESPEASMNNASVLQGQINTNISLQELVKENKSVGNKESNS